MQNRPIVNQLFNPHTSFIALPILRWVVFGFVSVAVIISILIIINSHCSFDPSYLGFNQAATMFRVPIGVLATLIPLVALLAASHRSEQTKEQIRITSEQNLFSNYYKHLEEFLKHCKNWDPQDSRGPLIQNPRKLYGIIYQNSKNGDYDIDEKFKLNVDNYAKDLHSTITNTEKTPEGWRKIVHPFLNKVVDFFDKHGLFQSSQWDVRDNQKYKSFGVVSDIDIKNMIGVTVNLFTALHFVLEFDVNYEPSAAMKSMLHLDIDDIPNVYLSF